MLPIILKVRYGRDANGMDRLMEIGIAIFLLVTIPHMSFLPGMATMVVVMGVFSFWVGKTSWLVFSSPPLSVPAKTLIWDLSRASWLSIPAAAGLLASVMVKNPLLIVAMFASCAVMAIMVVALGEVSKNRQNYGQTVDNRFSSVVGPYQYFALDLRRRRTKLYQRVVVPFMLLPLIGIGITILVMVSSGATVTPAIIAAGFALGFSFNFMYLRTDDLPGSYLRETAGLPEWFVQLPYVLVVGFCAALSYILDPDGALFLAVVSGAVAAALLGFSRIIIGEHTATVALPHVAPRSTMFQEIMGFGLVLGVFSVVLVVGKLV